MPIARASLAAGHTVAFACQAAMLDRVRTLGFAALDTGGATLRPPTTRLPLAAPDPAREARVVRDVYAGRIARERAARMREACRDWRPDVVVCDEMDFGAMVAAESFGLGHATVNCLASAGFAPDDLVGDALAALRADHGLPPDPEMRRRLVLSPFPPSLRDPGPPPALALRHADPREPGPAPPRGDRPLVYVTLGTIFSLESGDLLERLLAGVSALLVDVVATVGAEVDPAELCPQPPNVRVERYVPQALVLPHCSLVVSHGGSGSVVGALAHGVPMLLAPLGADQPLNARRCEELGVARTIDAVASTPGEIGEAAADVLGGESYRAGATRIRDEILALPGPEAAVARLVELAHPIV